MKQMESIKPALLPETLSLFSEANALTPHLKDSNSKKVEKAKVRSAFRHFRFWA